MGRRRRSKILNDIEEKESREDDEENTVRRMILRSWGYGGHGDARAK